MIDSFDRRSCSPKLVICTPSISSTPSGSAILNRAERSDDLPAPVRPTIPTCKFKKLIICDTVDTAVLSKAMFHALQGSET